MSTYRGETMTKRYTMRLGLAMVAVVMVAVGCSSGGSEIGVSEAPTGLDAEYSFVIALGSGEAIDRGEPLEIMPESLDVRVGEVIEIVNHDDRGHNIGPFFVGAYETVRHEFTSTGVFEGICSVHPSGQIVLTVVE